MRSMLSRTSMTRFTLIALLMTASSVASAQRVWRVPGPEEYKREIPEYIQTKSLEYEEEVKRTTPPEEAVMFVGSATVAGWDLDRWFPEFTTIKRGWGGCMIDECTKMADQFILPHKPAVIVLYAGDNDIWLNKSPELTLQHYKEFERKVREPLPDVEIIFISIRYSIARWDWYDSMRKTNDLISDYIKSKPNMYYVDINTGMMGPDKRPRKDFLHEDNLHLSEAGFAHWSASVSPVIKAAKNNYDNVKRN